MLRLLLPLGLLGCFVSTASAEAPLHERIDQLIAASKPPAAPLASDAEFLRRVYLDLAGMIPPAAEARAFLRDPAADKRARLIDRLLASPEHARHLQYVFDRVLLERRRDTHVPHAQWLEYLHASFQANKPWDVLVRELLSADGADPKLRPAASFALSREGEPNLLTRDVGRLFLGMNLQCAQCHDHPLVPAYHQDHYQGVFAFLNRTSLFVNEGKPAVLAEKADGEVSFQSVFDPAKVTKMTGPRLPGLPAVEEPKVEKGKEYVVAPAKGVRPVPKYSRRAQLADRLTAAENVRFRRNGANRLWALLLGRGLVHPVDLDHDKNPPSHPELLNLLGDELAGHKYDMRYFLREVALSQTYQRSSEPPAGGDVPPASFGVALLKPLSPEQLAWSLMQAAGLTDAERLVLRRVPEAWLHQFPLLSDAEREACLRRLTAQGLYAKLAGGVAPFINTFGSQPGQPEDQGFDATLDQTLFLRNGGTIRAWLAPRPGNLTDRLAKLVEPRAVAEELFLSVLTRLPTAEEEKEVADCLARRTSDRAAALQDLAWALLASAEFRFNH